MKENEMRQLNFNHLRYFWAVAHEGSLTRAAARLHLSQSALSVQIQKLEHQVGHPLFERVGRSLVLTEAGQIALDYADTIFAAGDELVGTLSERATDRRVILRVGALTTLSRNFQLEFLQPLAGRPDVELIVRSGNTRDLLAQLESHALDVVLTNTAAPLDARSSLRNHLLAEQPVSLVGRPTGTRGRFSLVTDLASQPLLLPSQDSEIRIAFDRLLEAAGVRPAILAEVDDMAMLRLLAREWGGVTLVPPIVVRDELEAGVLEERLRIPEVTERFYAIVKQRRFPNRLVGELLAQAAGGGTGGAATD
jgi:LysR family transcriptional activator of nhaA